MKKLMTVILYALSMTPFVANAVPIQCTCFWSTGGQCPEFKVVYWIDDLKTCCLDNKLPGSTAMPLMKACQGVWQLAAMPESEYKTRCNMGCIARVHSEEDVKK